MVGVVVLLPKRDHFDVLLLIPLNPQIALPFDRENQNDENEHEDDDDVAVLHFVGDVEVIVFGRR
jgi:hypothetical protein